MFWSCQLHSVRPTVQNAIFKTEFLLQKMDFRRNWAGKCCVRPLGTPGHPPVSPRDYQGPPGIPRDFLGTHQRPPGTPLDLWIDTWMDRWIDG